LRKRRGEESQLGFGFLSLLVVENPNGVVVVVGWDDDGDLYNPIFNRGPLFHSPLLSLSPFMDGGWGLLLLLLLLLLLSLLIVFFFDMIK